MAESLTKGLTEQAPFNATTEVKARGEKTQRAQKDSKSAGKKGGKSFKFC